VTDANPTFTQVTCSDAMRDGCDSIDHTYIESLLVLLPLADLMIVNQ
jgi:hypothetical protein